MKEKRLIICMIGGFTILQIIILFVFGYTPYPDSESYLFLANQALQAKEVFPAKSFLNDYPFLWNIGAITVVELFLWLFHSITPLLLIYSFMKGATAWLFYDIVKHITNHKTALLALSIYVLYPANYGESTSILSELPFMFFSMIGIWCIVRNRHAFMGGILIAIANWFRPMGIVYLIGIVILLLFKERKKAISTIAGYVVAICMIGFITMSYTGLFLYQSKTGWRNLAVKQYDNSDTITWKTNPYSIAARKDLNVSQKDDAYRSVFINWVLEHPIEYVKRIPEKLVRTYISDNVNMCAFLSEKMQQKEHLYDEISLPTLFNSFPHYSIIQWFTIGNLCIYYLIILTSICSIKHYKRNTHIFPLSIIIICTFLLLFFGHGESRFHIILMPWFIILAAIFLSDKLLFFGSET